MSFSYDPSLSDDISKVRFLVQDKVEMGRYLEDEEIQFLIAENATIHGAAAEAALAIYNQLLQASTVAEVDDIRIETRDRAKFYKNVYDELKNKASTKNFTLAPIFIGGADRKQYIADSEGRPHQDLGKVDTFFDNPRTSY